MQVKMKTTLSGPEGNAQPGEIIDVSSDVGADLVAGGYATKVEQLEVASSLPESAAVKQPETAVQRRGGKRQ